MLLKGKDWTGVSLGGSFWGSDVQIDLKTSELGKECSRQREPHEWSRFKINLRTPTALLLLRPHRCWPLPWTEATVANSWGANSPGSPPNPSHTTRGHMDCGLSIRDPIQCLQEHLFLMALIQPCTVLKGVLAPQDKSSHLPFLFSTLICSFLPLLWVLLLP